MSDYAAGIAESNTDIGAIDLVHGQLQRIVLRQVTEVGLRIEDRKYVVGLDSGQDDFTVAAKMDAYDVLYDDIQHDIYKQLAALITGSAMAEGDEQGAKYGHELGQRIVTQRAHKAASAIGMSFIYPAVSLTEEDKKSGTSLLERVNAYYLTGQSRSPLARTPQSEGMKFEELLEQIRKSHNLINASTPEPQKTGILKRISRSKNLATTNLGILRKTKDKDRTAEVVEEMFDTYITKPWLEISDSDAQFVASYGLKAYLHYEQAAKANAEIAEDPRIQYIGLLTSRLTSCYVVREAESFRRSVRIVAKHEQSHSS